MIEIHRLDIAPYEPTWALQKQFQREVIDASGPERIIVCQHPPTITLGTSFKEENLKVSRDTLAKSGIQIFTVERGGDVTYHGPGQVVLYPILDLRKRKTDVSWFMRKVEQVGIEALATFGLQGSRSNRNPGIWIGEKKIASCGVKLSRWCSMHGIAINLTAEVHTGFSLIQPCGLAGVKITSLSEETQKNIQFEDFEEVLLQSFFKVF